MKTRTSALLIAAAVVAAAAQRAPAQQAPAMQPTPARPTVRATVSPANASMSVALTVRGANAEQFLDVEATNADVRDLLREMARKSAVDLILAPSATGHVSTSLKQAPMEKAYTTVAGLAGLIVRKIVVPEESPTPTPDAAGRLAEALDAAPAQTTVTDPATGKSLVFAAAPAAATGKVVYYVQGKLTMDQEIAARDRQATDKAVAQAGGTDNLVNRTVQSLKQLPLQDRVQAMRNLGREMMNSITPEERQQLRGQERQQRNERLQQNPDWRRGRRAQ